MINQRQSYCINVLIILLLLLHSEEHLLEIKLEVTYNKPDQGMFMGTLSFRGEREHTY